MVVSVKERRGNTAFYAGQGDEVKGFCGTCGHKVARVIEGE